MDWYKRKNRIRCGTQVDRAFLARDLEAVGLDENGESSLGDGVIPLFSARALCCLVVPHAATEGSRWRSYRELLERTHDQSGYYKNLFIPKRNGGSRAVYSAEHKLRRYQKWLLNNVLCAAKSDPSAAAYIKGRGIRENAATHAKRKMLVKLDIESFFDSVTFNMVLGALRRELCLPDAGAVAVARLCTLDGRLPQGACTSPMLANLCMKPFDSELAAWCAERNITYTRYSDDMIFSAQSLDAGALIRFARSLLKKYGFALNEKKTRVLGEGSRMQVTGVVVNDGLSVPKEYKRAIRQELYYIDKYGLDGHVKRFDDGRFMKNGRVQRMKYLRSLLGRIRSVQYIERDNSAMEAYAQKAEALIKAQRDIRRASKKLFLYCFNRYDEAIKDLVGNHATRLKRAKSVRVELLINNSAYRPWLSEMLDELIGYIREGVKPELRMADCSALPYDSVIIRLFAENFKK